jgi:hypothetical protein
VLESLSSWLERLARLYDLSVKDLLTRNLDLVDVNPRLWDLDYERPAPVLAALAERAGVELTRLTTMTLAGWAPWLFDSLSVRARGEDEQHVFDTYVRANSVLLAPGEAGTHYVDRFKPWCGPWLPISMGWRRVCPVCTADPDRGRSLMWKLPLMIGCVEHGCWLEHVADIEIALLDGQPLTPRPVEEPLGTLDRYTHDALTTGRVELPGRSVHAGVWFRLLRSLLDELSLATTTLRAHGRTTIEQVWQTAGRPERGGLTIWRPFEQLDWDTQEAMLHAAAVALDLAATGRIIARGRLASALAPPRLHVYDGDPPAAPDPVATAWAEAVAQMEAAIKHAHTDRDTARQLLSLLTFGCRTLDRFEEQRAYLFGIGIPAEFLPSAREFGRDDLV